jgi:hypothetical protein
MSQSLDIFVGTDEEPEALVREWAPLLGVQFHRHSRQDEVWYEAAAPRFVLTVGEHTFENDRHLNFEDYRYDISIRPTLYKTEAEWYHVRNTTAQRIFQNLKRANKYRLLMVDNIQVKLDEFQPVSIPDSVLAA